MGLREQLRRLRREAEGEYIEIRQKDGTAKRFPESEFEECFLHETDRGRRHHFGEEPGPAHPMVVALREVSDAELARLTGEHGTLLGALLGEDEIMRGERERSGPPVRETGPGVYE